MKENSNAEEIRCTCIVECGFWSAGRSTEVVARRKNGLEVHSSRLQPYPGQNHHWKSLKSYLNGFIQF